MASFPEKFAAGSYTVDTGSAYCPNHLYLIDEGSGTTLTDRGKTGGLNMTITGATWGTSELTAGGGTSPILTFNGVDQRALSSTSFSFGGNKSILLVCIFKTTYATPPTSTCSIASAAYSGYNTDIVQIRGRLTDGYLAGIYDDSVISAASQAGSVSIYNQLWHMAAVRVVQTSATTLKTAISLDGAAWSQATYTIASDAALWNMNRLSLGDSAGLSPSIEFEGSAAALFVYRGLAVGNVETTWDSDFISALYSNPWQFLTTTTKRLRLTAHPSAASATGVKGAVYEAPSGTDLTGAKIGEFTGAAFEAGLEGGAAVLKVDVDAFGGTSLTTSDTPVAAIKNTTYQTGFISCSVIEE